VRRLLLSPRWLALHAVTLACVVAFIRLGVWQWDVRRGPYGALRNLAYGLQWWIFAGFTVFMWWRMLRAELGPPAAPEERDQPGQPGSRAAVPRYQPPASDAGRDDGRDDELAAYNRYLADLNAQAHRSGPA
jgi:hypothetical protein